MSVSMLQPWSITRLLLGSPIEANIKRSRLCRASIERLNNIGLSKALEVLDGNISSFHDYSLAT